MVRCLKLFIFHLYLFQELADAARIPGALAELLNKPKPDAAEAEHSEHFDGGESLHQTTLLGTIQVTIAPMTLAILADISGLRLKPQIVAAIVLAKLTNAAIALAYLVIRCLLALEKFRGDKDEDEAAKGRAHEGAGRGGQGHG